MIKFINIDDNKGGHTFDGSLPYIHWFKPCSIELYNTKTLWILCDKNTISIEIPGSMFSIYNPTTNNKDNTNIDLDNWQDISSVLTQKATITSSTQIGQLYIFQVILLAKSFIDGEYITDFTINGELFKIGAEFYNENESLKINLQNMGVELPQQIVKTIYEADIQEDHPDWVLLNRKRRELLANYMDIIGCKGSYKSLLTSLEWFEYGSLVELREVWKHSIDGNIKLSDRPIQQLLDSKIKESMDTQAKTTYFIIRHLTKDIYSNPEDYTEDGCPIYKDKIYDVGSLDDKIDPEVCMWSKEEMRLKMQLLGQFFEAYFMPIHLDLLHSVVEDIFFNAGISDNFYAAEETDSIVNTEVNDFEISTPDEDEGPGDNITIKNKYRLGEVEVWGWAGMDGSKAIVPFCADPKLVLEDKANIVGCTKEDPFVKNADLSNSMDNYIGISSQYYKGIGAYIPLYLKFTEKIINAKVVTNINNVIEEITHDIEPQNEFDVAFLGRFPGKYYFIFTFLGETGMKYTKRVNIEIVDNIYVSLGFYKLVYKNDGTINPFSINYLGPNRNMFSREHSNTDNPIFSQEEYTVNMTQIKDIPASGGSINNDGFLKDNNGNLTNIQAVTANIRYNQKGTYYIYDNGKKISDEYSYSQFIPTKLPNKELLNTDYPRLTPMLVFPLENFNLPLLYQILNINNTIIMNWFESHGVTNKEVNALNKSDFISIYLSQTDKDFWVRIAIEDKLGDDDDPTDPMVNYIQLIPKDGVTTELDKMNPYNAFKTDSTFIRNVYIPEYHGLEAIDPNEDISDDYPIVAIPYININSEGIPTEKVNFSLDTDGEPKWIFKSRFKNAIIDTLSENIQEPFLASRYIDDIPLGRYEVTFQYKYGNETKKVTGITPNRISNTKSITSNWSGSLRGIFN